MALQGLGTNSGSSRAQSSDLVFFLVCLVCQLALATQLNIAGGTVNFMLIFAGVTADKGNIDRATLFGFSAGLAFDLTSTTPVGLMALLLTLGSFLYATIFGGQSTEGSGLQVLRFAGLSLAVNVVFGLALFFMGVSTNFLAAVLLHPVMSAFLTALVSWVFFRFFGSSGPSYSVGAMGGGRPAMAMPSMRKSGLGSAKPRKAKSRGTRFKQPGKRFK